MRPRPTRLLQDALIRSADELPAKAAVVEGDSELTYGDLHNRAARLATAFRELGVARGDRVVVYCENSAAACVSVYATLLAGGVFAVVNPQTKTEKLRFIVEDAGAALVVADHSLDRLEGEPLQGLSLRAVVRTGTSASVEGPALDGLVEASEPIPSAPAAIPLDLAALIYTSGSTGTPKGVMMSHSSMVFASESILEYLRLGRDDRILDVLPLSFDYGLYQLLMTVALGATLVLERGFVFPPKVLDVIEARGVTVVPGVPTMFAGLLGVGADPGRFRAVRRVTNTAAGLPSSFVPDLRRLFPNALVFAMYGLTECKRVSYLEPELLERHPTSVGRAIPGTEAMVLDHEGRRVGPGEVGILHVRGPHVMAGYWRRPDLTDEMLVDGPVPGERMLRTGDWFRIDDEGLLYFVGRSDDIIKTRGEKVSPAEVENVLYGIEGVAEAAVVGIPDPVLGEAVVAYVVPRPGAEVSGREIVFRCRAMLESFMVPRDVHLVDELPKTASGKISKVGLRPA